MAFKISLGINTNQVTIPTKISFLKVLYNVCKGKKNICFEQYACLHLDGPEIAICETASYMVFVLNSSFTTKDEYFRVAIAEACEAFNKMLLHFGYTQISKFMIQISSGQPDTDSSILLNGLFLKLLLHSQKPSLTFTLHVQLCLISSSFFDEYCS